MPEQYIVVVLLRLVLYCIAMLQQRSNVNVDLYSACRNHSSKGLFTHGYTARCCAVRCCTLMSPATAALCVAVRCCALRFICIKNMTDDDDDDDMLLLTATYLKY